MELCSVFGYIRVYKPQLKFCEYDLYQSVYCTLCRTICKNYGPFASFLLNFDYTFVAMLKIDLAKSESKCEKGHCTFNPLHKCPKCVTGDNAFDLTSALTAVMFYHKIRDNINDSGFFGSLGWRFLKLFAAPMRKKAKKQHPEIDEIVGNYIDEQVAIEKSGDTSLDSASEPTAKLISSLAVMLAGNCGDRYILERFGYFLGRWIYQIDAQDDLEKDVKHKGFNPIAAKFSVTKEDIESKSENLQKAHVYANEMLNMTMSAMLDYYDILDLSTYKSVLDNIVFIGMPNSQKIAMHLEKDAEGDAADERSI